MDAGTLHAEIAKVCPVTSVSMDSETDRTLWTFTPAAGATQPQLDAAQNVIQTIPLDAPPPPTPGEEALYDHESRLLALEGAPAMDIQAFLKKRKLR
jgi:hypothetical protein